MKKINRSPEPIVWQYVTNFLQGSPIPGVEHRYKFLQQVLPTITLKEVNAVAKKMPGTDKCICIGTGAHKHKR